MPDILERKIGGWNTLRKTFVAGMIYARKISFEENPSEVTSVKKILSYFSENLTTLIDEIIYLLEPGKIETGVWESDDINLDL